MNPTRPSDFPDWLPPMLVKELRQGLRGSLFLVLFLILQVAMTGVMIFATVDMVSPRGGELISIKIFMIFSMMVLIVQPLRGLRSLADEIRENTLETLAVAGQGAGKMVFGKWAALSVQTVLLFITLLPYLILRYSIGGMNLVSEVVTLGLMLVLSLAMTAAAVAFSAYRSSVVRYTLGFLLLGVAAAVFHWLHTIMIYRAQDHFMSLATRMSQGFVAVFMVYCLHMIHLMLSHGTSLIAPAGEKRAAGKRLASVVMLLALVPVAHAKLVQMDFFLIFLFMVTGPALVIALTESGPAVERPSRLDRLGSPGRVAGAFLRPTRESGSLFAVLFFCLFVYVLAEGAGSLSATRGITYAMGELSSLLAIAGALLVPASWQAFFFREDDSRMGNYLLILLGSAAVMAGLMALPNDYGIRFAFFAWHPLAYLELAGGETSVIYLGCVVVIHLLAILISTLMRMKRENVQAATLIRQTLPVTAP